MRSDAMSPWGWGGSRIKAPTSWEEKPYQVIGVLVIYMLKDSEQ